MRGALLTLRTRPWPDGRLTVAEALRTELPGRTQEAAPCETASPCATAIDGAAQPRPP